jgi:hypothetical protein
LGRVSIGCRSAKLKKNGSYIALIFTAMAMKKNWFIVVSSAVAMALAACLSDSGMGRA